LIVCGHWEQRGGGIEPDTAIVNARAEDCSAAGTDRGERTVRYNGGQYVVIGLYFASGHNGQRELCYILRHASDHSNGRRFS